ncbi:MAG TPA: hypothetical protein ENN46_01270 [Candidatus Woesearchaeota archaeon]|nr:hypothetical protein [Candidatus Woesearchaeota archaeon]
MFLIGSGITVLESPNPLEKGISGKVVLDLKNSVVLQSGKKFKVILKKNRFFRVEKKGNLFIINGNALQGKLYSRKSKKGRMKNGKKNRSKAKGSIR